MVEILGGVGPNFPVTSFSEKFDIIVINRINFENSGILNPLQTQNCVITFARATDFF